MIALCWLEFVRGGGGERGGIEERGKNTWNREEERKVRKEGREKKERRKGEKRRIRKGGDGKETRRGGVGRKGKGLLRLCL